MDAASVYCANTLFQSLVTCSFNILVDNVTFGFKVEDELTSPVVVFKFSKELSGLGE